MARVTKVRRLPAEVRELIGRLRGDGRTLDEIMAKLRELDVSVARTTLYRHLANLDAIGADIARTRAIADAYIARYGDAPEGKVGRLNGELLHGAIFKTITAAADDGKTPEFAPGELMALATALQRNTAALKADAELTARIRKEFAATIGDALEQVEQNVAGNPAVAPERRKSMAEVLRQIRHDVYGLADEPPAGSAGTAAPRKGLSPETIRTIESEILGIAR